MKYRTFTAIVVLLLAGLVTSASGQALRLGTAGAPELVIPYGSRGTAMAGSVVSNVTGLESMFWNPAGLASLRGTEAMFTHLPYIADIDVNFAGVATHIEEFGTIGIGAKVVSIGTLEETTDDQPDGTGREFDPSLTVLNVSYARVLTANVSFGASVMFINESIFQASATGVAFDVGFLYDPRWNGFTIGMAIKNYGPEMSFDGIGFEVPLNDRPVRPQSEKFDLPSSINIGVGYNFIDQGPNNMLLTGNFRSNNYSEDYWQGGAEYTYNNLYTLRAGYNFSDNDDWIYGVTFGAGLSVDLSGTMLTFEYAWNETDVFDDNQYFTVKANF